MRDDIPSTPASPSALDNTPLMFRLESDNRESNDDSEVDTHTPVEREHEHQQYSEAFQHSQPGYIPDTIDVWIPEFGAMSRNKTIHSRACSPTIFIDRRKPTLFFLGIMPALHMRWNNIQAGCIPGLNCQRSI